MSLILKRLLSNGRTLYLYFPKGKPRTPFRRCSLTILRDAADEASVDRLLWEQGLAQFADEKQLILVFPNPLQAHWDFARDADAVLEMQDSMTTEQALEPAEKSRAIPPLEKMLSSWHPMNDTRYLAGFGSGASLALTLAACRPQTVAAVLALGGALPRPAPEPFTGAPVPAWLCGADEDTLSYFLRANAAAPVGEGAWACPYNPVQRVVSRPAAAFSAALLGTVWAELFAHTRRTNAGPYGSVEPRSDLQAYQPEIFVEDTRLGDQNGLPHTWFTFVPQAVRSHPETRVPLVLFFHGGSDNPAEAAEMTRLHELGERENFITVYPWGSNRASWNIFMTDDGLDDVAFSMALIHYMIRCYPVDASRVYLTGFSNGASQAMVDAMTHPDEIAAIFPIDANWPGERFGPADVRYEDLRPMAEAFAKKRTYDYRMPVWYTYGTREASYPVYARCSQQHQYDFWKQYNHIPVRPTPPREHPAPCGAGVPGDVTEVLRPDPLHPAHWYSVNRFFTSDPVPCNYYNYVLMHDKGHEISFADPLLGWEYVRQFRRGADGSVIKLAGR